MIKEKCKKHQVKEFPLRNKKQFRCSSGRHFCEAVDLLQGSKQMTKSSCEAYGSQYKQRHCEVCGIWANVEASLFDKPYGSEAIQVCQYCWKDLADKRNNK